MVAEYCYGFPGVMVVRHKGETTEAKPLPGGGPQGTLLGLLLFLILINQCGFENQTTQIGKTITNAKQKFANPTLHTKYVDDLLIAEAINLKKTLLPNPSRPLPDQYHARLGLKLPPQESQVYDQLNKIQKYATENQMKLNNKKGKFMIFNPTIAYDIKPEMEIDGNHLETLDEIKLLGLTLTTNLKWKTTQQTW